MVEALKNITVEATAPFKITFIPGEVMNVMTGPRETERQHVERDRSFTFFMVEEIGPRYTTLASSSSFSSSLVLGPMLILLSPTSDLAEVENGYIADLKLLSLIGEAGLQFE